MLCLITYTNIQTMVKQTRRVHFLAASGLRILTVFNSFLHTVIHGTKFMFFHSNRYCYFTGGFCPVYLYGTFIYFVTCRFRRAISRQVAQQLFTN